MRTIDRRTAVGRRALLASGAAAPLAATLLGAGFTAGSAWAQGARNLSPHQMATIAKAARDIFPHDFLADKYYIIAVTPYDAAAADPAKKSLWVDGVARLDAEALERFKTPTYLGLNWEADRTTVLRAVEMTPFFRRLRADLVVSLYNQEELWPKFGYEGSSAEYGGYIARGFDDIDWLPTV